MTQSPTTSNTTIYNYNGKPPVRQVNAITLYCSGTQKFELLYQGAALRYTVKKNGEYFKSLYYKVDNVASIEEIELKSERWELCDKSILASNCSYIIMKQQNAAGKCTGCIKIVKRSRARVQKFFFNFEVKANRADWIYYRKENGRNQL